MDEFLDTILSTSPWSDVNSAERSSWVGTAASQTTSAISDPLGTYRKNEQNPAARLSPSSHMIGGLKFNELDMHMLREDTPILVREGMKYNPRQCFFSIENQMQQDFPNHVPFPLQSHHENQIHESIFSLPSSMNNAAVGSFGVQHDSVGSNDTEPPIYNQSLEDSQSTSAVPLWPDSYSNIPPLPMDQANMQNFGLQGEFAHNGADALGERCNGSELQSGIFARPVNDHNSEIPSFSSSLEMNATSNTCMQPNHQCSIQLLQFNKGNSIQHYVNNTPIAQAQCMEANGTGPNGAAKPRTRAKRGQATDPHSIAERLRREKIAERMKNLQELVPNSNKTDKSTMLDEIIDYVKFLQLQVKVLSMSRVGAAGAVVPLITDAQPDATGTLISQSVDVGGNGLSEVEENLTFEQEVVNLLESNITTAMQYLQTKGLCLMPIALAAAISSRKDSFTAIPPGTNNPDASSPCVIPQSNERESMTKEKNQIQEQLRSRNGIVPKQENSQKFLNFNS